MSTRSERKQNRIDRYNELARKAETKSIEAFEHSNSIVKCIPMGQPILVGHHSEKRHRRDLDKSWNAMGKSVQESEKAEYYRKKAEAAENNNAIYTEDEDSVERLEEKIARPEKLQQAMKDRNKIVRDKKLTEEEKIAKLIETGMTEKAAQGLIVPDVCNDIGYAACYLTNNSATIRNAKKTPRKSQKTQIPRREDIRSERNPRCRESPGKPLPNILREETCRRNSPKATTCRLSVFLRKWLLAVLLEKMEYRGRKTDTHVSRQ